MIENHLSQIGSWRPTAIAISLYTNCSLLSSPRQERGYIGKMTNLPFAAYNRRVKESQASINLIIGSVIKLSTYSIG